MKKSKRIIIHWFRQDLRLHDNPALRAAVEQGDLLPIYILDDDNAKEHAMGQASRVWLHHSLNTLNESLEGHLRLFRGNAEEILLSLVEQYSISAIYWNRCYEPWRIRRDKQIKQQLIDNRIHVESFNSSLLWEPWEVLKKDGTPYRVFTPYFRKGCLSAREPRKPLLSPDELNYAKINVKGELPLSDLDLIPKTDWHQDLINHWEVGESGAQNYLDKFLIKGIDEYDEGRNFPAKQNVSRLSPYLHFGQISVNQVWYDVKASGDTVNQDRLLSELGWREFSYSLLYHFPELPKQNLQPKFDRFEWLEDKHILHKWQTGQTGYPIIDAGMRELWQTGYMHNRVRMIVGSFLVKNLLLHWHVGEKWFWDCLVDADLASNSASWQWIAGCGADAAPYFRIFNPVTQGEKFDRSGEYTRKFVPELKKLPNKYLFKPWEAPMDILEQAGIILGKHYPKPIVEIKASRERALLAFQATRVDQ